MIFCHYHPGTLALYVYKCHGPYAPITEDSDGVNHLDSDAYNRNVASAHHSNLFLCAECVNGIQWKNYDGTIARYGEIRTVKIEPDKLPDNWEKVWHLLYSWDGEYIFVEPKTQIYFVGAPYGADIFSLQEGRRNHEL